MTRAPAAAMTGTAGVRSTASLACGALAWTFVLGATAVAFATSIASVGALRLQSQLAATIVAHGLPAGAGSLGWFGALVVAEAARVSPFGPAFLAAACAFGASVFAARRARALGAPPAARVLAVPLAALCALDALHPGGGAASWFFAAFVMVALASPSASALVLLFLATVAWCNVEPGGLLAPVLASSVAAGASFESPRPERLRERWLAVVLTAVACLCTPAGLAFPNAAFEALRLGGAANGIVAVVPAVTAPHAYRLGAFALFALALAIRPGTRPRDAVPVAVTFVLALANGAFVPLFGIVAAPALAAEFGRTRVPAFAAPAVAALFAVAVVAVAHAAPAPALVRAPFELAARAASLDSAHVRSVLLCANVEWCDAATAAGERVVLDGRFANGDVRARTAQRTVVAAARGWRAALERSGATEVLARRDSTLDTLLSLAPEWRALARTDGATLYGRADGATINGRADGATIDGRGR